MPHFFCLHWGSPPQVVSGRSLHSTRNHGALQKSSGLDEILGQLGRHKATLGKSVRQWNHFNVGLVCIEISPFLVTSVRAAACLFKEVDPKRKCKHFDLSKPLSLITGMINTQLAPGVVRVSACSTLLSVKNSPPALRVKRIAYELKCQNGSTCSGVMIE